MPAIAAAQNGIITGKVISADLQIPLNEASVFLSNATYGTATASNGTFTLQNIRPGQYELVVSYVGYDSYHKTIMVTGASINLSIEMHLKSYGLNEVAITSHKFSKENFAMFVQHFLGVSQNAKQCKIINPKAVDLYYNAADKVLKGHSDDFIIIENRALGYKLKYLLGEFKWDGIDGITTIGGQPLYEDLKGSKAQLARWHQKREEAYHGSSMHFYRSLINNEVAAQGFMMYHLVRVPNSQRPPQHVIVKKIDQFMAERNRDSVIRWQNLYNLRKYIETLGTLALLPEDVYSRLSSDVFALHFPGSLYVVYTKKHDNNLNDLIYRPLTMENFQCTIVTLYGKFAQFDLNGVVIGGDGESRSTLNEGAWADNLMPELLPVNYVPDDKKTTQASTSNLPPLK
ncbi:carboxypeptidase-like regulatory domain-containing protein [Mucilaginibacter gracilis]|nr:carboxypeptidase-like regulatory domain-containing protein [Mucilaginibacter gracilis]